MFWRKAYIAVNKDMASWPDSERAAISRFGYPLVMHELLSVCWWRGAAMGAVGDQNPATWSTFASISLKHYMEFAEMARFERCNRMRSH